MTLDELKTNSKDISLLMLEKLGERMPGGFFVYKAYGDEKLLYANDVVHDIFGCDNADEFKELTGFTFPGMVYDEDLERIEKSITEQVQEHFKKLDYVEYRIRRKDGEIRWVDDYGRLDHTEEFGDVFYVLIRDITELHNLRESLTDTDYLTTLYNRRHFDGELLKMITNIVNKGGRLCMIMIDIDKFKNFNDLYGHLVGDRCLTQVAAVMRKAITNKNFKLYRYGGEEFAVLLPDTALKEAALVAEEIRLAVRGIGIPHEEGPQGIVTISAGIAEITAEEARSLANPPSELIRLSDASLYEAKKSGRDTCRMNKMARCCSL